jgi:heme/copper-type cytochrome/quinol oxidase subunit 4
MMWIPGLTLLQSYFVIGFGLGVILTLLFLALILIAKNL